MAEYTGRNGLKIHDSRTAWGWNIQTDADLLTALEGLPEFETVAACFIQEAIKSAAADRAEWETVQELAEYIAENYI